MPTYEYVCTDCENHWEEVQKISEDALKVCPKCEKSTAKRQISGGNFILKGGGWYADAYSSVPKPKSGGDEKSSSGSSGGTGSAAPAASPASPKGDSGGSSKGDSGGSSKGDSGGSSSGGSSKGDSGGSSKGGSSSGGSGGSSSST